jgi:hypothetical protein
MTLAVEKSNLQILSSGKPPPRFRITPTLRDDCLCDPSFAAQYFFNAKPDEFQKARFKICWWTPRVMDSSGFSSSKTWNLWMISVLRCLLMEDHVAGVYYQVFSTGQKTYWKYFNEVAARSEVFRHHLGKARIIGLDGKTEELSKAMLKGPSCWSMDFKNGSQIMMPAAGFASDAKTQASIRLNDLFIDEWTKIMAAGSEGIDDQLIGRATRECFNKDHPLWCNHQMFLATAEDTMHPGYARYKTFKKEHDAGNPLYYVFSFSYKDYSRLPYKNGRTFADIHREEMVIDDMRKNKSAAGFRQEALGIWSANGRGWYTGDMIDRAYANGLDRQLDPMTGRHDEKETVPAKLARIHYFLSLDPARAEQKKADDGSMVVLRAFPKVEKPTKQLDDWQLDYVWAYRVRKADVGTWSALTHRKHQHFGSTGIILDPGAGGGGNWIKPELAKSEQRIRDQAFKVKPIGCEEDEASMPINGQFILSMFKRGDAKIDKVWPEINMRGDDNLIDAAHSEFWEAWNRGVFGLPAKFNSRPHAETDKWSEEKKFACLLLEMGARQLTRICVQTNDDGSIFYSKHNARLFSGKGRKDFAYAMLYAFVRFLMWVQTFEDQEGDYVAAEDMDQCG